MSKAGKAPGEHCGGAGNGVMQRGREKDRGLPLRKSWAQSAGCSARGTGRGQALLGSLAEQRPQQRPAGLLVWIPRQPQE